MDSKDLDYSQQIRWIGFLFVIAMAAYASGTLIVMDLSSGDDYLVKISENSKLWNLSGVLYLLNSFSVLVLGILAYPILKRKSQASAGIYLGVRVFESTVLAIGFVALLSVSSFAETAANLPAEESQEYYTLSKALLSTNWFAYHSAMAALGFGSLVWCRFLWQSGDIPKTLTLLGFIGYPILGIGSILVLLGYSINPAVNLLVFIFEVAGGLWLLIKRPKSK